jgi:hypothetical protein
MFPLRFLIAIPVDDCLGLQVDFLISAGETMDFVAPGFPWVSLA